MLKPLLATGIAGAFISVIIFFELKIQCWFLLALISIKACGIILPEIFFKCLISNIPSGSRSKVSTAVEVLMPVFDV